MYVFRLLQGVPNGVASFGVYLFYFVEKGFHLFPSAVMFKWTLLHLFRIIPLFCEFDDVGFMHEAERTNDLQWHLFHFQDGGHTLKSSFMKEIQKCCVYDVVHVMSECYLVESMFLSEVENCFSSLP